MHEFETVFREYQSFIFNYLRKMTQDPLLAEELTQETFFRAYMNYSSLRNPERVSAWLCQIAKNTYFAWYRERKIMASPDTLENMDSGTDTEEQFIRKELSLKALQHLHDLEEPYKEVFMLSVFGGFSLKEISLTFGKSESWARVTFYRAKQKLSERMKK